MDQTRPERILAIDFGTSTCAAGIATPSGPQLVVERGEEAIPSCVFFPMRGPPVLGSDAVRMLGSQPTNTVRSVKRLLGRAPESREVVAQSRTLHYSVAAGPGNTILLELSSGTVTTEQVVAHVFRTLRDLAERRFACRITSAVATVPAVASAGYIASLKRAARLAHINIIETLPEPVAGALPMRLHLEQTNRRVLICDFGGGTFDATLIDAGYRRLDVLATHGDDFLGGDDFDQALMEAVASVVFSRSSFDMLRDAVLAHRLLLQCEVAKRGLSSLPEVRLRLIDAYRHKGRPQSIDAIIERTWIEPKWAELVARSLAVVESLLASEGVAAHDIDQVALIGGSSMIPLFRRELSALFRPGVVVKEVGAATAVVGGAVLRAATHEGIAMSDSPEPIAKGA